METKRTFTPPPNKKHLVTVFNRTVDMSTPSGQKAYTILRQCEILADSGSVINNSCNMKTVISRIDSYESALKFLSSCSAADLKMCRLKTPEQLSAMYNTWQKNKTTVINKAILRSYEDTVFQASKLKTIKGQDARVSAFFDSCAELSGLNADNLRYLQHLIQQHMDSIIAQEEAKTYDYAPFFALADKIQQSHSIQERLSLCEQAAQLLPGFVSACIEQDGELPPSIICRDYAPIWYMRTGNWEAAANYINYCISCNAYFPEDGTAELQYLDLYRHTAETALAYITQNPGCLQNQLYKNLGNAVDKECLMRFTRYSYLISKVPYKKTNKLYVGDAPQ